MISGHEMFLTSIIGFGLKWGTIAWFLFSMGGTIYYATQKNGEPLHFFLGATTIWFFAVLVSMPVLLMTIVIDLIS